MVENGPRIICGIRSFIKKKSNIICLDGDGALIMHLGSLANVGFYALKKF